MAGAATVSMPAGSEASAGTGFSVRKTNLIIIFSFILSLVFYTFPVKEKDAEVKTQGK